MWERRWGIVVVPGIATLAGTGEHWLFAYTSSEVDQLYVSIGLCLLGI